MEPSDIGVPHLLIAYVVQHEWDLPWEFGAARALFFDEMEARSYLALIDVDGLVVRRQAIEVRTGGSEIIAENRGEAYRVYNYGG